VGDGASGGTQATDIDQGQTTAEDGPVIHPCPPDPECPYCRGTIQSAEALDWSFLDSVYCISLKSRDDRAQRVAEQFHKTGLCRQVVFYRPTKHPKKGIIGSWESHRAVARLARERGCRAVLVCEDDVLFVGRLTPGRVRAIGAALQSLPANWMIFHLGHWPLRAFFVRRDVLQTVSACAHAYVASPRLQQWLTDRPYGTPGIPMYRLVGRALDAAFACLDGVYALFPMVAIQSVSRSDNFNTVARPKTKLKHLVTRSKHREWLLSNLMRPAESIIVVLSPVTWLIHRFKAWRNRGQPSH